jgi:hypothetical protein
MKECGIKTNEKNLSTVQLFEYDKIKIKQLLPQINQDICEIIYSFLPQINFNYDVNQNPSNHNNYYDHYYY